MNPNHRQVDLILQSLQQLPTLSPVAVRLLQLSGASDPDFDQIIKLIELDPALSAKVISLVRKVGVGASRAGTITSVRRAAVMLGLEAVQAAVLSVQVYEVLSQSPAADQQRGAELDAFDREGFWRHAIAVACAAQLLAQAMPDRKVAPDEAFVAGLVHALGKLALDWVLPKTYDRIVRHAQSRSISLAASETAALGLDHHQAGKRLAEHWSLPHALQDVMWLYAQPPAATPDLAHRSLIGAVSVASALAQRLLIGWSGNAAAARSGPETLLEQWAGELGLEANIIEEVQARLHDEVAERARILGIGEQTPQQLVLASITAANDKLARLHEQARTAARAAVGASRALAMITDFAGQERPGGTLNDTLARIAQGWTHMTGKGPLAIVCQVRSGSAEPWRFIRCDAAGAVVSTLSLPAPADHDGEPVDLRSLAGASLGSAFEMAQWLARRLADSGSNVPVSRLGTLALNSALGPAAVIVHEPVQSTSISQQALATVTTVWAWAVGASAQAEGSRRIAERLATTAKELALTQAKLAEAEAMARLGEFTSGAAHEMNNPLTVISGRAQLLAERAKDPKTKEDAAAMVKAADALTDLVTQLHTVASPPLPRIGPVPIPAWADGVLADARKRASIPATLAIKIEAPDITPAFDAQQVARAAAELLVNALQSQPKSGVTLRIRHDAEPDPITTVQRQFLRVSVIDDGRGMSDYVRKHACDPFFSALPAGRRPGLGLALAKRLVEASSGRLEIESRPERGTVATITIPAAIGANSAEPQSDHSGPARSKSRAA